MIISVTATNYLGEKMTFELAKPNGVYIKSIDGLGPAQANINTTELSSNDGSVFNSARLNQRNIVITFGLMFNPMIEDMRHTIYKYFPMKKPVRLDIVTDRRKCYTIGYVETNNPDIFNKEETQQVSIICPSPWLYGITDSSGTIDMYHVAKKFEFDRDAKSPIEQVNPNQSLGFFPTDGDNVEFGEINKNTATTFTYEGDDDTGVRFTLHFLGSVYSDFSINDDKTNEHMTIKSNFTGGGFNVGDTLYISTVKGNKYVRTLERYGSEFQNAIALLDRNSSWLTVKQGENSFSITSETSGVADYIQAEIDFDIIYMGV